MVPLAIASCGSGPGAHGSRSPDASLGSADATVERAMTDYLAQANSCTKAGSPVVCLEAADRRLGGQIHTYANLLVVGHGFTVPQGDLTAARNSAQTLANSLEILGDAQPTQANYDQVRNTFDVDSAIGQLKGAVATLHAALGG